MSIFVLSILLLCVVLSIENEYPSPLRSWQTGVFTGNPEYSPIGVFTNYTVVFRENDGITCPPDVLLIETSSIAFSTSTISDSYQQWTVVGTELTYCGLLTQNNGKTYEMTRPQFKYQPQLSSEYKVYFCADARGGGCDTFWWEWKYYTDTGKMSWNNTVGGVPHELTYFDFVSSNADLPVQMLHRAMCSYILGTEMPYDYGWIDKPYLMNRTKLFNADNRRRFKENIANYEQHYQHRINYN